MNRKTTILLGAAVLILLLTGCNLPATTPGPGTVAPDFNPSDTPVQTDAPLPDDTDVPAGPTSTNIPDLATTEAPSTEAPIPTNTPGPPPGEVLYVTDFNDLTDWTSFPWWKSDVHDYAGEGFKAQLKGGYVAEILRGTYHFEVPKLYTNITAIYGVDLGAADVEITANTITVLDRPFTFTSVVCRYSDDGWYEFFFHTDGYWGILKVSYLDGTYYNIDTLANGATSAINTGDHQLPNDIIATCQGNTLSLWVNNIFMGSAEDDSYTGGLIGIGVGAGMAGNSHVEFDALTVKVPAP